MTTITCPSCNAVNRSSAKFCAECGASLKLDSDVVSQSLKRGEVLQSRYRIEQELGRGGFGAVYKAWDANLSKLCAVKENLETSPAAQRQFKREATVLAGLTHPNLPRVIDHFIIQGQGQYLVMDFVEGEDLQALSERKGAIPVHQALEWISQVADALAYLHSSQPVVVHRDIKPANIRITPQGRAVLVDFGLVKLYNPSMRTTAGARAITPGYAPPEQYGRGGTTDARSDIYALGATLYTLLTGKEPVESVERLAGKALVPIQQTNPEISPRIGRAIERAMHLEPGQRFQTAAEFAAALRTPSASESAERIATPAPTMVARAQSNAAGAAPAGALPQVLPAGKTGAPDSTPRKSNRLWLWLGIGGVLICCFSVFVLYGLYSLGQPVETATNTPSPALVFQATETPTVTLIAPAATNTAQMVSTVDARQALLDSAKLWPLVLNDDFLDNSNDWYVGQESDDLADISWTVADGRYRWEATANQSFGWWVYLEIEAISDFYLTSEMRLLTGPPDAEMGLIFRVSDDWRFYLFEINGQGQFSVFYFDSTEWFELWSVTDSSAIRSDRENRLSVIAQGDLMTFFINDQYVAELRDDQLDMGKAGFYVGLANPGDQAVWEFYDFILRVP